MHDEHLRPITSASAALAALCAALWGANATAAQFTQDDLPPLGTAGIRFAISVPFLAAWFRMQGTRLAPQPGEWPILIALGLFVYIQIGSFHYGLAHTNAAHGSIILGMNPVVVGALAHLFLRGERMTAPIGTGLLVAAAGLVMVVAPQGPDGPDPVTPLGDLIMVGSCLVLGFKIAYSKRVLRRVDPGRLLFWSHIVGFLLLLATSGAVEGFGTYRFSWRSAGGLAFMGIVIAFFCFAAWTVLLRKHPATQLQVFAFGQPVFGVVFGWLFRGDPVTWWLAGGAVAIGAGIALVTWGGNRRAAPVAAVP